MVQRRQVGRFQGGKNAVFVGHVGLHRAVDQRRLPGVSCTCELLASAGLGSGARQGWPLWFRGIARLPSVAVSSLGLLSPVTAVLLGWVLLGQTMTGVSLVGMLVVLASILVVQWAMSRAVLPAVR